LKCAIALRANADEAYRMRFGDHEPLPTFLHVIRAQDALFETRARAIGKSRILSNLSWSHRGCAMLILPFVCKQLPLGRTFEPWMRAVRAFAERKRSSGQSYRRTARRCPGRCRCVGWVRRQKGAGTTGDWETIGDAPMRSENGSPRSRMVGNGEVYAANALALVFDAAKSD
jgi:hypothetical protein